jgi:hypothetical protein
MGLAQRRGTAKNDAIKLLQGAQEVSRGSLERERGLLYAAPSHPWHGLSMQQQVTCCASERQSTQVIRSPRFGHHDCRIIKCNFTLPPQARGSLRSIGVVSPQLPVLILRDPEVLVGRGIASRKEGRIFDEYPNFIISPSWWGVHAYLNPFLLPRQPGSSRRPGIASLRDAVKCDHKPFVMGGACLPKHLNPFPPLPHRQDLAASLIEE